jgi:hypothetical protein
MEQQWNCVEKEKRNVGGIPVPLSIYSYIIQMDFSGIEPGFLQ